MFRTYRYRLYPTRAQEVTMRQTLEICREVYNAALQERRDAWRKQGITVRWTAQFAQLKHVRAEREDVRAVPAHLAQDAIRRVHRCYERFFRQVKNGERAGLPRFRTRARYRSFTFNDCSSAKSKSRWIVGGGRRLSLTGIGDVKIKLHRAYEGKLKQVTVTLDGDGHWYACLGCADVPPKMLPQTGRAVGVDVGITHFATLSNGEQIGNPRFMERAQRRLASAHRRVDKRRKGSRRRSRAIESLARRHARVRRARLDFHHKVALDLVRRFDVIHVEDLNVRGLVKGKLGAKILDAAWGGFVNDVLASKAESAGRELRRKNPWRTSQECSGCGAHVPKRLDVRVHSCLHCGLVLDRDHNAAINIENRPGHGRRGGLPLGGPLSREAAEERSCHHGEVWVESCVHDDSELHAGSKVGASGALVVIERFAEQKGWA